MIAPFLDTIQQGDCLEVMRTLPDDSVHAIITDPPAGIAFMNKTWDANKGGRDAWIAWLSAIMMEAMRCLKPGGHALVWALPRTSHWTATALEDAGFEVRDCISHFYSTDNAIAPFLHSLNDEQRNALEAILESQEPSVISAMFGSGFPKSLSIDKAIDAHLGKLHERKVIGTVNRSMTNSNLSRKKQSELGYRPEGDDYPGENGVNYITAPATDDAKRYSGYGTALKPSNEHWILCRKPLSEPTIAANVLKWDGCGAINIDKCRISHNDPEKTTDRTAPRYSGNTMNNGVRGGIQSTIASASPSGRFPSNTLFSHSVWCVSRGTKRVPIGGGQPIEGNTRKTSNVYHGLVKTNSSTYHGDLDGMEEVEDYLCHESCPVRILDEQSGIRKSGARVHLIGEITSNGSVYYPNTRSKTSEYEPSTGTASRFFQRFHPHDDIDAPFYYAAKASRRERNNGLEGMPEKSPWTSFDGQYAQSRNPETGERLGEYKREQSNHHPTVKSLQLMRYLVTLVTPENGIVLDPFAGSGSTLVACVQTGHHFIGIEQEQEYVTIARARLAHATKEDTRKASLAEHNGK